MLKSPAFKQAVAFAALLCGLSSANAQASETPPAGITCSGVMTFISGPQTSLQCSSDLVLQYGLLEATDSITLHAVDSIFIGKDMVVQAHDIFLSSNTIVIDGILNSPDGGSLQIITVDHPTLSVPEASTTAMTLLGLLALLAWRGLVKGGFSLSRFARTSPNRP